MRLSGLTSGSVSAFFTFGNLDIIGQRRTDMVKQRGSMQKILSILCDCIRTDVACRLLALTQSSNILKSTWAFLLLHIDMFGGGGWSCTQGKQQKCATLCLHHVLHGNYLCNSHHGSQKQGYSILGETRIGNSLIRGKDCILFFLIF